MVSQGDNVHLILYHKYFSQFLNSSTTEEEDQTKVMPQFKVFVNDEMGMAKQMVVRDKINQMVAVADHISRGSDT